MASIAYVTDQRMIEFHRLNGNRTINFWRPGNMKKFSDFQEGDTLFFLVKGTERPNKKEKGILGYGRLVKTQTMTIHQMWNTYKTENGYRTEEELNEAILKVSKDRKLPQKINSLYLSDVVFFQSPVYLSEIGVEISNRLESYVYLDQKDPTVTARLLNKAKESGMDFWALAMSGEEQNDNYFEEEEIRHLIASIAKRFKLTFTDWEKRKAKRWMKEYQSLHPDVNLIKGSRLEAYQYKEGVCTFILPLVSGKELDDKTQAMVGHALLLKQVLQKECQYQLKILFKFLSDEDTSELEGLLNQLF